MSTKFGSRVLLTGAGFTHNFGGYLADHMWEHILNRPEVSKSGRLVQMLLDMQYDFNYETIYAFMRRAGETEEFKIYLGALEKVYGDLDKIVQDALEQSRHEVSLNHLWNWCGEFDGRMISGQAHCKGFIFTLNHDLYFERHLRHSGAPFLPGIPAEAQAGAVRETQEIKKFRLPKAPSYEEMCTQFQDLNLIKLHGSCNWTRQDGKNILVIGEEKLSDIEREPLLSIYSRVFKEALKVNRVQLWSIGYGFADSHINDIIADAIKSSGLRLYIISPCRPREFWKSMMKKPRGEELLQGIAGFIPNSLKDIFQINQMPTQLYQAIKNLMAIP